MENASQRKKLAKEDFPKLTILSFIDPRKPWLLVPSGSLMGYFDFVSEHYRIGPWTRLSMALPIIFSIAVFSIRPGTELPLSKGFETVDSSDHRCCLKASSYPEVFSVYWWYNVIFFVHMTGLVCLSMFKKTPFIIFAYTMQSWVMNSTRHGLNALAPFLNDGHFLLHINRVLRFPALLSSVLVFVIWNFILLPFFYVSFNDTKRKDFMKWNIEFRMVQYHICNVIYSAMNTLFTQSGDNTFQVFIYEDLWYALVYGLGYSLFYVLFLDRIGIHMYPVFSPRTNRSALLWLGMWIGSFAIFKTINATMEKNLISVPAPITFGIVISAVLELKSGALKRYISRSSR